MMKPPVRIGFKPTVKKTNKSVESDEEEIVSKKIVPVKKIKKAEPPKERKAKRDLVVDQSTGELIDPAMEKKLQSMFGKHSDKIIALLDKSMEDGASVIQQRLLQTIVNTIPMLEHQITKSEGRFGAHNLVLVCNTVREMIVDIQARQDRGMLGQSVVERHVRPSYMDIAVQIRLAFVNVEEAARSRMSTEDFKEYRRDIVAGQQKALAEYMTAQYEEVKAGVMASLT